MQLTKHEYICQITEIVRIKSSCFKRKVGAVFINDDYEILTTGFNEAPRGFPHCDTAQAYGGINKPGTCGNPCTRTIHAEQNAICQAAKRGIKLENSILYCTYLPCIDCARLLVNLKIKAVHFKDLNQDRGMEVLAKASIAMHKWSQVT